MNYSVGVVGGGINGVCAAWQLAQAGFDVTLYERETVMSATSRASSKLLHGGLRYLENFEFRLVREALAERNRWLERAPHLAKPLEILLPVYQGGRRGRLTYGAGLKLYDWWSRRGNLPPSHWISKDELLSRAPSLNAQGLKGAYAFWDGQMDDFALGVWATEQAKSAGVKVLEHASVDSVSTDGAVALQGGDVVSHDAVVNAAGPWANELANQSGVRLQHQLDLVRGSHLVLDVACKAAWLLEVPRERRVFFVLPWKGHTLVGTTEVRHSAGAPVACSEDEKKYLLQAYSHYFPQQSANVIEDFAGLRPLVKSAANPNKATREYVIEQHGAITTVLGGKWTTAMALGDKVCQHVINRMKVH